MGCDDLHHKRKAKSERDLARRKTRRAPYERVLIVCEGSKTEPNYLRELIDHLKLNTANVAVDGDCDSSPDRILQYAKSRYYKEKKLGDSFDKVYCVFDRDTHDTYEKILAYIAKIRPKKTFIAITSVPCFEYWLLLHFDFTARPFMVAGNKSGCDRVIDELRKYIPEYNKGDRDIFNQLMEQTNRAIANGKRAFQQASDDGHDNPSTLMHELVEYLYKLKGENV